MALGSTTRDCAEVVDLRLLDYISVVDDNLICPICRCPFVDPIRLSCDHSFCQDCVKAAYPSDAEKISSCPSCRANARPAEHLSIPRFVVHMLDELVVKCPNHLNGCMVQMRRGDVQDHLAYYCAETQQQCPFLKCDKSVARKRKDLACPHRVVVCERCDESLMELDSEVSLPIIQPILLLMFVYQSHYQTDCKGQPKVCPECECEYSQGDYGSHLEVCSEATLPCVASSIGCLTMVKRTKIEEHQKSCTLVALWPTMQAMNQRIGDQEAALKLLQRKNTVYEDGLLNMGNLLTELPSRLTMRATADVHAADCTSVPVRGAGETPPLESAAHHLLSLHESLREELDRVSAAVFELDARSSMMIINESLRLKEEMTHTNAAITSLRAHLQWLMSTRLQQVPSRINPSSSPVSNTTTSAFGPLSSPSLPVRRLSDSARQDTKL